MANEVTVVSSLLILSGKVQARPQPTTFRADCDPLTAKGPTPGAVACSLIGTLIDLSQLTTPGFCRFQNLYNTDNGATNAYIEVGIYDQTAAVNKFYPLFELMPGETFILRLSRFIGQEFGTAASGTAAAGSDNRLMAKSVNVVQNLLVEAYQR